MPADHSDLASANFWLMLPAMLKTYQGNQRTLRPWVAPRTEVRRLPAPAGARRTATERMSLLIG